MEQVSVQKRFSDESKSKQSESVYEKVNHAMAIVVVSSCCLVSDADVAVGAIRRTACEPIAVPTIAKRCAFTGKLCSTLNIFISNSPLYS